MSYSLQYFLPSTDELTLATQLLEMNSWNRTDSLSVDTAIGIFKQSGLSFKQLRDIWSIADKDGSGKLSREELAIVIRLMGWVQAGVTLDESLLSKVGPLPKIKGIPELATPPKVEPEFPPLTIQKALDMNQAFFDAHPVNGTLQNRTVMEIFMRLKPDLSFETLLELFHIMKVAEKNEFGEIGFKAFAIGMHIVTNLHNFPISSAPISVPPEFYSTLDVIKTTFPEGPSLIAGSAAVSANREAAAEDVPTGTSGTSNEKISNGTHHSITLPAAVDSDIQEFMRSLAKYQCIDGHPATKFMSTYNIKPVELAEIWRKTDFDAEQHLSTSRLSLIEELVRAMISAKISQALPLTLPPPSYRTSSTEQGVTKPQPELSTTNAHDSFTFASLSPMDPPEYKATHLPVATSMKTTQHNSFPNPPSSTLDQIFLNGLQDQITGLPAQLETVVLEQTATQSDLRSTVKSLQEENIQLRLREQELQAQLARKKVEYDEGGNPTDPSRIKFLEGEVAITEYIDAVECEDDISKKTRDIQSKQIASLLELVSLLGSTIKDTLLNPALHDLRQKVIKQEQEITELRGRLKEKNSSLPVSLNATDLPLALRDDDAALKAQVEQLLVQCALPLYVLNEAEVGGNTPVSASSPVSVNITRDSQQKFGVNSPYETIKNQQQPLESTSQLEYDLILSQSDLRRKSWMAGRIVQRFISEYGLDALLKLMQPFFSSQITNPSSHPEYVDAAMNRMREAARSGLERSGPISSQSSASSSLKEDEEDKPGPPSNMLLSINEKRFPYLPPKTIRKSAFKAKISNPR